METKAIILCENSHCSQKLRVPCDKGNLIVTCPKCGATFLFELSACEASHPTPSNGLNKKTAIVRAVSFKVPLSASAVINHFRKVIDILEEKKIKLGIEATPCFEVNLFMANDRDRIEALEIIGIAKEA